MTSNSSAPSAIAVATNSPPLQMFTCTLSYSYASALQGSFDSNPVVRFQVGKYTGIWCELTFCSNPATNLLLKTDIYRPPWISVLPWQLGFGVPPLATWLYKNSPDTFLRCPVFYLLIDRFFCTLASRHTNRTRYDGFWLQYFHYSSYLASESVCFALAWVSS